MPMPPIPPSDNPPGPAPAPSKGELATRLFSFLDECRDVRLIGDLNRAFKDLITAYGYTSWHGVCAATRPNQITPPKGRGIGEPPVLWLSRYIEQDYMLADPVVKAMLQLSGPFFWSDVTSNCSLTPIEQQVVSEAREYGLGNGLVQPSRLHTGEVWITSLAGEHIDPHPVLRDSLGFAAQAYTGRALFLIRHNALVHPGDDGGLTSPLSPREAQVVAMTAAGLGDQVIADKLGITVRTVRYFKANARERLGVNTTAQLIAAAIRNGLIPDSGNSGAGSAD